MGKRGLAIVLIFVAIVGAWLGHQYQTYRMDQTVKESGFDNQGWRYYQEGDIDKAIRTFMGYVEKNPENYAALIGLGWSHYADADYGAAEEWFSRAVNIMPKQAEGHSGLGWSRYGMEDYQDAIIAFEKGIELDADNLKLREGVARSYLHLGKHENALNAYDAMLLIGQEMTPVTAGLFRIIYEQDGRGDARDRYLYEILPYTPSNRLVGDPWFARFERCLGEVDHTRLQACDEELPSYNASNCGAAEQELTEEVYQCTLLM